MDKLRLEETVYSIQPQTERKTEKSNEIKKTKQEEPTELQYIE